MAIISLKNVSKHYLLGKVTVEAVKNVSFELAKGDFVSIIGPSGSGKSTILNMIGLIDTPTSGDIFVEDTNVYQGIRKKGGKAPGGAQAHSTKAPGAQAPSEKAIDKRTTELRHSYFGFIFQNFNLIPVLNVYENIEFPLLIGKVQKPPKERREWIEYLIEEVGLENHVKHKTNELSGGQRQRVSIARALVTRPSVILADEPTANLDSKTGVQILDLMQKIKTDLGTTFIFSTHDEKIVARADHLIRLLDGEIIENTRSAEHQAAGETPAARPAVTL
jgi:putative ABC transport system ATP-binding protein